jgi:hypothetical protein
VTIGDWVRRDDGSTKWHLVDSVVDGEPFTRCGRRLRRRANQGFEAVGTVPLTRMIGQPHLCQQCQ